MAKKNGTGTKTAKKNSRNGNGRKTVVTLTHNEASRKNIPTAEYQSVMRQEDQSPIQIAYERRNRDLDPQLVWHGKDEQDWSDLVVPAPPVYIQEKVHPKALIDDLRRRSEENKASEPQIDLFANFNGLPSEAAKTEFYQHEAHWSNRMILGDSLQVMASLAEREGLRGKVQCIYIDPPYGIRFNSNFQWSTTSRDVKDGNVDHITREPEQVKAFRDTWRDGIHSYLTYLRDRLTVARDLLTDSGSIFVQIGDENLHRVRSILDEVFGDRNLIGTITFQKTGWKQSDLLSFVTDNILWYAKSLQTVKYRQLWFSKLDSKTFQGQSVFLENADGSREKVDRNADLSQLSESARLFRHTSIKSAGRSDTGTFAIDIDGRSFHPGADQHWKTTAVGLKRLTRACRLLTFGSSVEFVSYLGDFPCSPYTNVWSDTVTSGFADSKLYVVQTNLRVIERCVLMATDPGDLVLDPTCGSGSTAYVAEQWGRRWITIDTSRVALALTRARIMGARYPYYLLADSRDGQIKEAEITRTAPSEVPTHGNVRQGFVYERVPHITLKSVANNAEVDVIWEKFQQVLESLRQKLNAALGKTWEAWEIPREADKAWPAKSKELHAAWWEQRMARQKEIDASIAAQAEFEYLYDKPYLDNKKVRVAGPFTVESLSPHRSMDVDEDDELIPRETASDEGINPIQDFVSMILENLKNAGVQQAHKEDKIVFTALTPWPGDLICAEGRYFEGDEKTGREKRAAIFIGPEFGTVSRPDLVAAAREAGDANFDVLITCAFNYDARSTDFDKLGRVPVLKARMNADLHMGGELKNTGKGNLFVIFGEPDIEILHEKDQRVRVKVRGVDVFDPSTGDVRSDNADGIACWFIDTDYNEESFFVRHAYFLGANDPYKSLKTTLKAEINEEAWETLHSDTSRPFPKPESGRIAVKVINHLGDEVMKVFRVN
jgi:adenine-specific DNA-methyltransferase